MQKFSRIYSVGASIAEFLKFSYQALKDSESNEHPLATNCEFKLVSSDQMEKEEFSSTTVTLFLYRVVIDEYARNTPQMQRPNASPFPLPLCLCYLITIWADNPVDEQTITAWVMSQLHQHPILDQSTLSESGGWGPEDEIHLVPVEMSNEDLMRIWDAMKPTYRLSIPYTARVVRIDPDKVTEGPPVVATRYGYGELEYHEKD